MSQARLRFLLVNLPFQPPNPCPKCALVHCAHTERCGHSSCVLPVITCLPHVSLSSLSFISSSSSSLPRAMAVLLPLHWSRAVWTLLLLSFPAPWWAEGRRERPWEKAELSCPGGAALSCSPALQPGFGAPSRWSSCAAACGAVNTSWCLRSHPGKMSLLLGGRKGSQFSWKSTDEIQFSFSSSNVMPRAKPWPC